MSSTSRLAWLDWMRGLACVLMFQTHCYDAWLRDNARQSSFFMYSQLGGTLPAPLFLFLAGVSFALVGDKLIRKQQAVILAEARTSQREVLAELTDRSPESRTVRGNPSVATARLLVNKSVTFSMFRRGAGIFAFGLLFRLQEYLISWGWAPVSDLFRVDILNNIGISMMLMAVVTGIALTVKTQQRPRAPLIISAVATAAVIALFTPPLWTTHRPSRLLWPLESYINGVHNLGTPQPWLFPIFPWTAFAFAGLAAGFLLFSDWGRAHTTQVLTIFGVGGASFILASRWFDQMPVHLYRAYDYWHTSPNFVLMRVGILLGITFVSYAWCRGRVHGAESLVRHRTAAIRYAEPANRKNTSSTPVANDAQSATVSAAGRTSLRQDTPLGISSPLIQLGQTSLLVYWIHIEFVYGRFSILPKRSCDIRTASIGLLTILIMMLALSLLRTRIDWKAVSGSLRDRIWPAKADVHRAIARQQTALEEAERDRPGT